MSLADHPTAAVTQAEPFTMPSGTVRRDISTALARLYRESFGRGPTTTATFDFSTGYVTFLGEVLDPPERILVSIGRPDLVIEAWMTIRQAKRDQLTAEIQRITGLPELHDAFQLQPERDLAIELFWVPKASADLPDLGRHLIEASTGRSPAHGQPG